MKKITTLLLLIISVYIMKDWFFIKGDTKCTILCIDKVKVLVCRDYYSLSQSSPSSTVIGVCQDLK